MISLFLILHVEVVLQYTNYKIFYYALSKILNSDWLNTNLTLNTYRTAVSPTLHLLCHEVSAAESNTKIF